MEKLIYFLSFILIVGVIFYITNIKPSDYYKALKEHKGKKEQSLKKMVKESKKTKDIKGIRLFIRETKEMLVLSGKSHYIYYLSLTAIILSITGFMIGLLIDNLYLTPVLTFLGFIIPFFVLSLAGNKYKKTLNEELETALGIITNSYLRPNNTFISAVKENIKYLKPPIKGMFERFLTKSDMISLSTKETLLELKNSINNNIFAEWIDGVIACLDDGELKTMLPPIVKKLSDVRTITTELDLLLFQPIREYLIMISAYILFLPFVSVAEKKWAHIILYTSAGKIAYAITSGVVIFTFVSVIKQMKQVEYRR